MDRFQANFQRIQGLMEFAGHGTDSWKSAEAASDNVHADLYRTVIVFLHAMFEDMLRTAAHQRLFAARAKKLNVGPHHGKQVKQRIEKSVDGDLRSRSFNRCADVKKVLRQMGLDIAPFNPLFPHLKQMMKRRHRIVHEADLPSRWARVPLQWTVDDNYLLLFSALAVGAFGMALIVSDEPADEDARWFLAMYMEAIGRLKQMYNAPADTELVAGSQEAPGSFLVKALGFPSSREEAKAMWEQRETSN